MVLVECGVLLILVFGDDCFDLELSVFGNLLVE